MDEMADAIRTGLAGADWDFQVEPRMVLKPTTPCIDIFPGDPSREEESGGYGDISGEHIFNVRARVDVVDHEANQEILLALLDDEGDLCLAAALLDDETLGGTVTSIWFQSISGFVLFPAPDGTVAHIGCLWRTVVIPARS